MHTDIDKSTVAPVAGLVAGLVTVARNGLGLFLSRLELAALELSDLRDHLLKLAGVLALAILAAWFAIAYGTVLLVYLAWASMGWPILVIMLLGFAALATGLLLYARNMLRQGKFALPLTMREVQADRDMLDGMR